MKVRIQVLKNNQIVEDYTVPDHSWIQTDTLGAQHVPAVIEPVAFKHKGFTLSFTPINPPKMPPQLRKILDGTDPKYGRDGFEWMGAHREKAGGTTLDRAREYCSKQPWSLDLPLTDDPLVKEFCETELAPKRPIPVSPIHFVVD